MIGSIYHFHWPWQDWLGDCDPDSSLAPLLKLEIFAIVQNSLICNFTTPHYPSVEMIIVMVCVASWEYEPIVLMSWQ